MSDILHTSSLSRITSPAWLKQTYEAFLAQADRNAVTGKANGSRKPYGIPDDPEDIDGSGISVHYGQGAAGRTPYISWWVVSLYYQVESRQIVLGIEEERYQHIHEMKPLRYAHFSNRKTRVAVFYEISRNNVDYGLLWEYFIAVSEEVIRLGLH